MAAGVVLAANLVDAQLDGNRHALNRLLVEAAPDEARSAAGYLVQALAQIGTIACNGDAERAGHVLRGLAVAARGQDAVETAVEALLATYSDPDDGRGGVAVVSSRG